MRRWVFFLSIAAAGCDCYSSRSEPDPCDPGSRCVGDVHEECGDDGRLRSRDCGAELLVCHDDLGCVPCLPGEVRCDGQSAEVCGADGNWTLEEECDTAAGDVCVDGACLGACDAARATATGAGCEFWATALPVTESAPFGEPGPFGLLVTNGGESPASVEVSSAAGAIDAAEIGRGDSHLFELEREGAYRVSSTFPVRATQVVHAPGDSATDGSQLLPEQSLGLRTVVLSWPQTIADTDDPSTDMESDMPAFLTVVGTRPATRVTLTLVAAPLPIEGLGIDVDVNIPFDVELGEYETFTVRTDGHGADFTGSVVESSAPVAVFAGSEASDVPAWDTLSERLCCAEHLEEQLLPTDQLGTRHAVPLVPARTPAVREAGGEVAVVAEATWIRVLAVEPGTTTVETTLDEPWALFELRERGHETIRAEEDFILLSDQPVAVAQFSGSEQTTGIPASLPAGAPAFATVMPDSRWTAQSWLAVPEGCPFDFVTLFGPADADPLLDGGPFPADCDSALLEDDLAVWRCQLSFPEIESGSIDPETGRTLLLSVSQADGVHSIGADVPIGLILHGFGPSNAWAIPGG